MIDTFLIRLTQFEKTGSKGKFLIPLETGKSESQIPLSKLEVDHVFRDLDTFAVR